MGMKKPTRVRDESSDVWAISCETRNKFLSQILSFQANVIALMEFIQIFNPLTLICNCKSKFNPQRLLLGP